MTHSLPHSAGARRPANYSRWRTATLAGVYVLFGLHIAHWKLAGRTLAPLELNEVMYTLELGIVTAGFLFMVVVALGTVVFGRFFCSWGCHILALEDLCAWILKKVRIRPKPVRSRVLLLVPPGALFYMFIWPQVARFLEGRPIPALHLTADADGWASFTTTDYWRNLPGPGVALLTFAVCGFAIVYVLGSRAFCTYGCPYGAVFSLLDRFAPGRIVAAGDCRDCGACTAACQSQVRVKEELVRYGMVVDPACLKDLDCVAACPNGEVRYGFRKPPGLRTFFSRRRLRPPWDFTLGEDVLMACVFVAVLVIFRGLYDIVPFLLSLGLGGIGAYLAVLAWRVRATRDVRWNDFQIKRAGRITPTGVGFLSLGAIAAIFTAHSGWIRAHDFLGVRAVAAMEHSVSHGAAPDGTAIAEARSHLEVCLSQGLLVPPRIEAALARLDEFGGDLARAEDGYRRVLELLPGDLDARLSLARLLARDGRGEACVEVLRAGLEAGPQKARDAQAYRGFAAAAHLGIGEHLADQGRLEEAAAEMRRAIEVEPRSRRARYELGLILGMLGRGEETIVIYEDAVALEPDDIELLNNLAYLLLEHGRGEEAERLLRRALAIRPDQAASHYNLGRTLAARGEAKEATEHFETAVRLDPRFPAAR